MGSCLVVVREIVDLNRICLWVCKVLTFMIWAFTDMYHD